MKNRREKYSRISSLEELRAEQVKLRMRIWAKERDLAGDAEEVKKLFSFSHLSGLVLDSIYSASPLVRSVIAGYNFISRIIRGRKEEAEEGEEDSGEEDSGEEDENGPDSL